MRNVVMALVLAMSIGCGAGAGGGSSSDAPVIPPVVIPPTLITLVVSPDTATLNIDEHVSLSVQGIYSDGSIGPVAADWDSGDPTIASVSTSGDLTAVDEGSTTIHATYSGIVGHMTVTVVWGIPADPGPVYGQRENWVGDAEIMTYPSNGAAPTLLATINEYPEGFVMNKAGTSLYCLTVEMNAFDTWLIRRMDPLTGTTTILATLPPETNGWFGLDYDPDGNLLTGAYGSGNLVKVDPITGAVTVLTNIGGYTYLKAAPGPGATVIACNLFGGPFGDMITKYNPATGVLSAWADAPAGAWIIPSGLVMDRKGEVFIGDISDPTVWKNVDVNGDGDARDAGEQTVFGSLPGALYDFSIYGMSVTRGRGILVNCQNPAPAVAGGIYWMADRNGDGDAADAGEVTIFNSEWLSSGLDAGCVACPR